MSEFVDAKGILADGSIEDISRYAIWESSDAEVAIADQGRILAQSKGDAIITVKYSSYLASFPITVEETIDTVQLMEQLSLSAYSYGNDERIADLSRAASMINITWTPSKNLTGWRGNTTFSAETTYAGVPYSQTPNQIGTAQAFASALSKADFYTVYTNASGTKMPRYGNDCSGFVSLLWNIGRHTTTSLKNGIVSGTFPKVGSYNVASPTVAELKTAYVSLVPDDVVVVGGSHTFMIAYNDIANQKVQCYEQTPNRAQVTEWTYTKMANAKYLPFSKK